MNYLLRHLSLCLLFLIVPISLYTQNYNNIINYNLNNTPTYGVKIKTNLPFENGSQMPSLKIEGYNYSSTVSNVATINLNLSWYIYNNNFYIPIASSFGGTAPDIWLSNESGKVVIFIDQRIFYQRFTVSVYAKGMREDKAENYVGWTVVDTPKGGTQLVKVPYKNVFGGKVGIGTENPQAALDVNGDVRVNNLHIGKQEAADKTSVNRISLRPCRHTGADWLFTSRDTSQDALLDFSYGGNKLLTLKHSHKVGILCEDPKYPLDVKGTIRATEVRIEAIENWSDFVFDKDYKLPSLQEVETHIKEYNHLPDIPSGKQVIEEGISLSEMQAKLLQKIEELTLYTIEQNKRLDEQQRLILEQNKRIEELEKQK